MNQFEQMIAGKMNLKTTQVAAVLALFAEGATIPFIARYRKDKRGHWTKCRFNKYKMN